MTKQEVIQQLEELLKQEDVESIAAEMEALEGEFQKASDEHEQTLLDAFIAEGGDEADFKAEKDAEDLRFKELQNIFNDRLEKFESLQVNLQEQSINIRREVIEELKTLIKEETDIARAFDSFKAIQEKWRNAAALPVKQYKQLHSEYSHQIDMFFYTIDIYRALKFHDFAKNLETKKALIERALQLKEVESIRKVEALVKAYQNEWTETGPVPDDQWKEIRDEFRKATNEVYDRIQAHYEGVREQFNKNLEAKTALVNKVKALGEKDLDSHKHWQDATEELLALQKEWRTIGAAGKKDNERVWKEFRALCDLFFAAKKAFYDSRKEEFNANRDQKLELIKKAEELKDNTEWKKTTEALIELQNQWKEIGAAGQRDEQKLWGRFRGACNHFFEAKKQYYATLDDRLAENQKQREELIARIEAFANTGDNAADVEALKAFSNEWRTLGHAPRKEADKLNDAYKKALDAKYDALRMDKGERAAIKYKSKVENLKQSDQSGRLVDNERRFIRDQIKKLEDNIALYENNLSFFGKSKGAEALKADVMKNIEKTREELDGWKQKLKMLQQAAK